MAKTKISEWSSTAGSNTDIDGINLAEGMLPSDVNNAMREMMSQIKDLQSANGTYYTADSDAIAVGAGGTGAITAATARTNLGVPSLSGNNTLAGVQTLSGLTASSAVATNASKELVSVTNTGTRNNVLATSPTITGATLTTAVLNGSLGATTPSTVVATTISGTDLTTTGNTILGNASTDTLNVGNGDLVKDASGNTFVGSGGTSSSKFNVIHTNNNTNSSTYFWANSPSQTIQNLSNTANSIASLGFYLGSAGNAISAVGGIQESTTLGALGFFTGGSGVGGTVPERMRIDSSGNVGVGVTPAGTGGCLQLKSGITFPATQSASTDANTLDDYEEGTWTPAFFGTTTAGTPTYGTRVATYTKVGRTVSVTCYISISNKGGMAGNLQLSGLPFTSLNTGNSYGAFSVAEHGGLTFGAGTTYFGIETSVNNTTLTFYNNGSIVNSSQQTIVNTADSTYIIFSGTYFSN